MVRAHIDRLIAVMAAAALAAGMTVPAAAQTEQQQELQATDISDDELQSYASATVEVQAISESWQPRIQQAETQEEAEQLGQQAQVEMIEAVESEGLSVDQYNQIYQLAQADANVRTRILEYMDTQQ